MKQLNCGLKHTLPVLALSFAIFLVAGCGGLGKYTSTAHESSGSVSPAGSTMAHFVIQWPQTRLHYRPAVIPVGTNRFVIYISGANVSEAGTIAYIVDKPVSDTSTSVNIVVPSGSKRLFSVQARQVGLTKFTSPSIVALSDPALLDGSLLASGNDAAAHDIVSGKSFTATIVLAQSGIPDPSTTAVATTINQVLSTYFPTVVAIQVICDQSGNPITNMNAGNFDVTENGTSCVITDVRTVQQASSNLSTILVLDRSGSMEGEKNSALEASASQFVSLLQPADTGEIINFSNQVEVTQPFTSDQGLLTNAIQGQFGRFAGGTALFDGIHQGITDSAKQGGREAVIVLTDGQNNLGQYNSQDDILAAKQNNIPIFTIGLGADADAQVLGDIAAHTGGIYTAAPSASDLAAIYQNISHQLNGQIQLSFISPDSTKSGTARHVVVNVHYGSLTAQSTYDYVL